MTKGIGFPFRRDETLPVSPLTEDDAIRESIEQILLVTKGERVYRPMVGSGLNSLLFEQNTPVLQALMREEIRRSIRAQEKRIQVIDILIKSYDNRIEVRVTYSRLGSTRTANIAIQRGA